eukprot:11184330-Lingulodinium_polyedra.AAC.1
MASAVAAMSDTCNGHVLGCLSRKQAARSRNPEQTKKTLIATACTFRLSSPPSASVLRDQPWHHQQWE